MASKGSRKGTGSGASGAGFRRTGSMPGADRRGAFIVYTDHRPDSMADTLFRMRWKLALVAAGFIVVGIALYLSQLGAESVAKATMAAAPENNEPEPAKQFQPPAIVLSFLHASTLEEKLTYVRNPGAMADSIKRFYGGAPNQPEPYTAIDPVGETTGTPGIQKFYVTFSDGKRLLAVVDTPAGPKIDWPAYARLNDVEWDAFQNGKYSAPKAFRVEVIDFDYYAGDFADSQKHKSFQISSPELEKNISGYAERGTPTEQALSQFSRPAKRRCILELAPPSSPDARQLRITGWVAEDWVRAE